MSEDFTMFPISSDMRLRVGRHVGRTLYVVPRWDMTADGTLVGVMDTPRLAAFVVWAVNTTQIVRTREVGDE